MQYKTHTKINKCFFTEVIKSYQLLSVILIKINVLIYVLHKNIIKNIFPLLAIPVIRKHSYY